MRVFLSGARSQAGFAEILEEASRSAGIDLDRDMGRARASPVRPSRLEQIGEIARELRMSMFSALLESYLEHQKPRKASPMLRSTDAQAIATELSITERMTVGELNRLRRRFALANHPDRVGSDERENATRRMMVANMLIDRAMKRRMVR
jgi:hypothetical protein